MELAQSKNPSNWHDFISVLTAINGRDEQPERRWVLDLQEAASLLEPNMTRLDEAFGVDVDGRVASQLEEFDKADRASIRQWEFEINRRLQ